MQDSQDSAKATVKDGPYRQCSLCAKDKDEALVACRDCTVRGKQFLYAVNLLRLIFIDIYICIVFTAHPSCIYSPEEMIQKANTNWQCERCKTCTVCCETSEAVSCQCVLYNILCNSIFN